MHDQDSSGFLASYLLFRVVEYDVPNPDERTFISNSGFVAFDSSARERGSVVELTS